MIFFLHNNTVLRHIFDPETAEYTSHVRFFNSDKCVFYLKDYFNFVDFFSFFMSDIFNKIGWNVCVLPLKVFGNFPIFCNFMMISLKIEAIHKHLRVVTNVSHFRTFPQALPLFMRPACSPSQPGGGNIQFSTSYPLYPRKFTNIQFFTNNINSCISKNINNFLIIIHYFREPNILY